MFQQDYFSIIDYENSIQNDIILFIIFNNQCE